MSSLESPAVGGLPGRGAAEPLLSYRDALNPRTEFDQLERLLGGQLNAGETASLRDFKLYIVKGEAAWVLDQALILYRSRYTFKGIKERDFYYLAHCQISPSGTVTLTLKFNDLSSSLG